MTISMGAYSMFRACGCLDPVCGCVCVVSRLWRAVMQSWRGCRDLGQGAKEAKETRVHAHTHPSFSDLRGASGLVRVTASEHSVVLKSITTATASHNPIPSHPIHELCVMWLACSPWGVEATAQALSAYSLCQLWLWVCGRGATSALKGTFGAFWQETMWIMQTHPYCVSVCVWEWVHVCAVMPVWILHEEPCGENKLLWTDNIPSTRTLSHFTQSLKFASLHLLLWTSIVILYCCIPPCFCLFSRKS